MVKVPTYNELEKRLEKLEKKYRKLSETEKDLRESEEKFRELIYNANSIIFRLDRDGNILFINEFAQSFFGYEEFEVLGKNIIGTITPETDTAGLDLKETHKDLLRHPNRYINFENENIKKNGEKAWIVWTNKAIYNNDGKLREILSIGNDNTKRKRAEDAQKESENLFNSFMNSLPALAFMKDLDGRYIYFNKACKQFYGVDPSERIGKTDYDLFPPETAGGLKKSDQTVMSEKRVLRVIERVKVGEDTQYHYTSKFPILKNGEPYFIAGIAIDITEKILAEEEKKNLEAQLLHAQKMESLGTLSGGIAHNFNNLLMGIQGNASLAKMDVDRENSIFTKLNNIEKLVQRGAKLTDQLLGYAQKGQFGIKSINLNNIIKETVNTFGETKKDITVHQDLSEDLFNVEADNDQIEQVLLNLFINASDARPQGGELFLKTMNVTSETLKAKSYDVRSERYILLEVKDTGAGIDKKTMKRIFEPFFTSKGMGRATGLGLSYVYGIIKGYGGYIDVKSEKDKGTTFEIYLPGSEKEIIQEENITHSNLIKGEGTILFVDDEKLVVDVGEQILKELGYNVLVARGGKEAIEIYKKNHDQIDLIILDMIMPDMSGGKTFDKIRKIDSQIKVLLSSGYSINGQATQILKRGCNGFIQKPFSLQNLSRKISGILETKN